MELDKVIEKRRSIRKFKKEIPDLKLIKQCIRAACHAPSAHNMQPWKFVIVTKKKKIEELSKTQKWSAFLVEAPCVIVVLADDTKSSHWVEDCSCAVMLLMLKAVDLGLGTCWSAVYSTSSTEREEYVKKVLGIKDKHLRVLCILGIGWPDEKPAKKKIKTFNEAVLK